MDKSMTGVVTQVMDEGFELADPADRHHIFRLSPDVSLEAGDLRRLQRDGTRVTVDYDDDTPDAHVAHRVFATPAASAA